MLVTGTDVHLRGIPPNIKTPLLQSASETSYRSSASREVLMFEIQTNVTTKAYSKLPYIFNLLQSYLYSLTVIYACMPITL